MRVQGSGFRVLGFKAQVVKIAQLFLRFRLFRPWRGFGFRFSGFRV